MDQVSVVRLLPLQPASGPMHLHVRVGFGQPSHTRGYLDGALLFEGDTLAERTLDLGPSAALRGRRLECSTQVHDLQEATNQTGVDYYLHDGANELRVPLSFTVAQHGDVVLFHLTVYFA
ncbi:MAG: hypothetical protein WBA12_13510 [Catalinimonas sp.]